MTQTVLVVETDGTARDRIATMLALAGYRALGAQSFQDACQALRDHAPDALVTEVRLNGYNGLQLLATSTKPLPAVVVSSFADRTLEAEARQLGAEYLQKPITSDALLAGIEQALTQAAINPRFNPPRRWPRRLLETLVAARIGEFPARIIEVSYGGMRFELEHPDVAPLPSTFNVSLADAPRPIDLTMVWKKRDEAAGCVYGAEVHEDHQAAWREVVDALR